MEPLASKIEKPNEEREHSTSIMDDLKLLKELNEIGNKTDTIDISASNPLDGSHRSHRSTYIEAPVVPSSATTNRRQISDHYSTTANTPATRNIHSRTTSCENCENEKKKATRTQEAFDKAMKLTKFLMEEVERLKTGQSDKNNRNSSMYSS